MAALEAGAIANPDPEEMRRVGHYWLRTPSLAPRTETDPTTKTDRECRIGAEIEAVNASLRAFAQDVHEGRIVGDGGTFKNLLVIGIGGSALGPQFVAQALGQPRTDRMRLFCFDNTDPDGMDRVLETIGPDLGRTLCIVISKSGGTKETENGMKEAKEAYARAGLKFETHAVAITMEGSKLSETATKNGWCRQFPIWDWVGGRTSETSAVGLLPAALQGLDIEGLLAGARACDEQTRLPDWRLNPAAQLALAWYCIGRGRGEKDMVVIPYKDRLELLARYLQQLVMESLGKKAGLGGDPVYQGLTVYGNKGSTDQHAYIQQLRDGLPNFFAVLVEVLKDRQGPSIPVDQRGATSGDYLSGFLLGTRRALYRNDIPRQSLTLTVSEVSPFSVGVLIALFERAVGLYAYLVRLNAYNQPGVQAGKIAATDVLDVQSQVLDYLQGRSGSKPAASTAWQIAQAVGGKADPETVFKVCYRLAANAGRGVRCVSGHLPADARFAGD
jgi:glucose-6-phosphate isomerase